MIDFPGTKVNLGLRITQRLDNGYHSLESIFLPIKFSDILEIIPTKTPKSYFYYSGIEIPGEPKNNLIQKAWHLLNRDFSLSSCDVFLHKVVPMGAGIGGGSADGSAMLKLINDQFELGVTLDQLELYAKKLGADCPFFIKNSAAYVEGIGDKMTPINIDLSEYYLFLVTPGIHINTTEAFKNCTPKESESSLISIVENTDIKFWKDHIKNDFEEYAFNSFPELKMIKDQLYKSGAVYASMTGTGSSIYGIFEKQEHFPTLSDKYITYSEKL